MADTPKKLTPEQEIVQLKAELKQRDDKVKVLEAQVEKKPGKAFDMDAQIPFAASWKTPEGKGAAKVRVGIPAVRLMDDESSVVSSTALLKIAAGKELTEKELKDSPALKDFKKEAAAALINQWCKMGVEFIKEVK